MSEKYKPKVGDKIKISHTGKVTEIFEDGAFVLDTDPESEFNTRGAEVEVLAPAGFKPGTVAVSRLSPETPAVRSADGKWVGCDDPNAWMWLTDKDVRHNIHFTVVYEPAS